MPLTYDESGGIQIIPPLTRSDLAALQSTPEGQALLEQVGQQSGGRMGGMRALAEYSLPGAIGLGAIAATPKAVDKVVKAAPKAYQGMKNAVNRFSAWRRSALNDTLPEMTDELVQMFGQRVKRSPMQEAVRTGNRVTAPKNTGALERAAREHGTKPMDPQFLQNLDIEQALPMNPRDLINNLRAGRGKGALRGNPTVTPAMESRAAAQYAQAVGPAVPTPGQVSAQAAAALRGTPRVSGNPVSAAVAGSGGGKSGLLKKLLISGGVMGGLGAGLGALEYLADPEMPGLPSGPDLTNPFQGREFGNEFELLQQGGGGIAPNSGQMVPKRRGSPRKPIVPPVSFQGPDFTQEEMDSEMIPPEVLQGRELGLNPQMFAAYGEDGSEEIRKMGKKKRNPLMAAIVGMGKGLGKVF